MFIPGKKVLTSPIQVLEEAEKGNKQNRKISHTKQNLHKPLQDCDLQKKIIRTWITLSWGGCGVCVCELNTRHVVYGKKDE